MHGNESVKLQKGRVAPMEAGVKGQRFAGLLDRRIELHVGIVMHRLVSGGADREADDAWCVVDKPQNS